MKIFILFVLFIWLGACFKNFLFSFVIYIIFIFCYLAEAFIQSDLQEAIKTNKRAIICKCYISILLYSVLFKFLKEMCCILSKQ